MDNLNLFHELETLLRADSRYCMDDGTLIKNKIVSDALSLNPELLKYLLSHENLKKNFFSELDEMLIFDKVKFQQFVMNKSFLPDSYTAYKNKIGLTTDDGRFISENREVVLAWPYKDCMLEGGQTKEDAKRNEIFWSETLAPDEINRLTEPKAFTGFKRYDKEGEHEVEHLQPTDNLIIKGNNLLALYSLRKKFAGRIKLIYIDPPYYFVANKSEDTFNYNSNFKLSTWCTFMKNRLEIARDLLSEDGAIFVQISDDGVGELHLILKDVFNRNGENNFINKITVKTKSPSGFASVNPGVFESAEYIIAFAKNKKRWTYNHQYVESQYDPNYKWYITNKDAEYTQWNITDIGEQVAILNGFPNKAAAIEKLNGAIFEKMVSDFALQHKNEVFQSTAIGEDAGSEVVEARNKSRQDAGVIYQVERNNHYTVYVYNGREMAFYAKKCRNIDGKEVPTVLLTNIWSDISYEGIAKEGNVKLKGGKKPEKLIRRIVEMASNPGDIVLDFFAGSGTTASVVHKLGRQFITCDQLDSQVEMSLKRLKNVVDGDQSGISKLVNWQGGGSFVYSELAKANQQFIDEIKVAETNKTLSAIWQQMQATGYLNYKINITTIDESAADFTELSLDDQKRFLIECLDKNMLYIPVNDMESEEYAISEEDKRLTKEFYKKI
jgi:adenine-specific DNA-methyltransferase